MSDELKLKIEFNDKKNSVLYNEINEKYLLTAENINEIKEVVNNLSDSLSSYVKDVDVLKYLTFIIPTTLDEECEYSFELEISTELNFPNNSIKTKKYTLSNNYSQFSIFRNGVWQQCTNNIKIISTDFGSAIQFNVDENFPSLSNETLVGRYKWINITNNNESEWFGCGIQNTINYDIDNIFKLETLNNLYLSGRTTLNENDEETYSLIGITENGEEIDLTLEGQYKIYPFENCTLNKNTLSTGTLLKKSIHTLYADVKYNEKLYSTSLAILFNVPNYEFYVELYKENNELYNNEELTKRNGFNIFWIFNKK